MINSGKRHSANLYVSSLPAKTSGEVLVVASRHSDAERICRLLLLAGYEPQWCNDPAYRVSQVGLNRVSSNIVATVLCHRSRSTKPRRNSSTINMPSQLPNHLREKRVIAVSDCMTEQAVVDLLLDGAHQCFDLFDASHVLQARLEAALRRHGRLAESSLCEGDIRFDLQQRRVTRAGKRVDLSPKEYELAHYLFSNRDRVVENGELMTSIWSLPSGMDTRRIDTAACRVRKKLQLTMAHGWELKRLRKVGYRLVQTKEVVSGNFLKSPLTDTQSANADRITPNGDIGAEHKQVAVATV